MSTLADKVQRELTRAIENDELILPTLPEVALQVREAAEDPDVSILALSKVIGNDAALTARIIKVVNSPLLRTNREITDLQMAISRLGINYTCNLATGLAMEQMFRPRPMWSIARCGSMEQEHGGGGHQPRAVPALHAPAA